MTVASLAWVTTGSGQMTRQELEEKARALGMGYRQEFVWFNDSPARTSVGATIEQGMPDSAGQPGQNRPAQRVNVVIPAGAHSGEVGRLLVQAGVIPDGAEFSRRVQELGVSRQLRSGNYSFEQGIDVDSVIAILMRGR